MHFVLNHCIHFLVSSLRPRAHLFDKCQKYYLGLVFYQMEPLPMYWILVHILGSTKNTPNNYEIVNIVGHCFCKMKRINMESINLKKNHRHCTNKMLIDFFVSLIHVTRNNLKITIFKRAIWLHSQFLQPNKTSMKNILSMLLTT